MGDGETGSKSAGKDASPARCLYDVYFDERRMTEKHRQKYPTHEALMKHVCSVFEKLGYKATVSESGELVLGTTIRYVDMQRASALLEVPIILDNDSC